MIDLKKIEKEYQAKFEKVKREFSDHENRSLLELFARMDLTDDEIWFLSYLEILQEDKNMVWEGFPGLKPDERDELVATRFEDKKKSIELKKKELGL